MDSPRKSGSALFLGGVLVFVGINSNLLAPEFFPVGLIMAPAGLLLFMKGNREAMERAEERAQRAVERPKIGSVTADAFADQQAKSIAERGHVDSRLRPTRTLAGDVDALELRDELEFEDDGEEFSVSTDVSFPVDVQQRGALADEIRKLQRLLEDGVIDEREFAAAKAKLLT